MFLDLLFPNRYLECNRITPGEEVICEICFDQVNFTHWEFEADNLLKQRCNLLFPTENAFALMQFEEESLSRKIVHALKYGNRENVGKKLGEWTSERLDFGNDKPDLIVTVPLHSRKQQERGYNQLHLFADEISRMFEIPVDHEVLKRNFYKKFQKKNKLLCKRIKLELIFKTINGFLHINTNRTILHTYSVWY